MRIFGAGIVLMTVLSLWFSWESPFSRAIQSGQPVFGLLIGTDFVDYARHSDTIMLVRYDPSTRWLDLLSIPRDTRVHLPHLRVKRINEVYAYAYRVSKKDHEVASRELSKAVQWLLYSSTGSDAGGPASRAIPPIDFYAQVDYQGFRKMIDLLGGVPITVDEPMHYDDHWGKLHIHFDPGNFNLNGKEALEYVRFRGLSGDYGRILRQQKFVLSILKRFKEPVNLLKFPKIIWVSVTSVETNLTWLEQLLVVWELKNLSWDRIRLMQLPGEARHNYWIPDPDGVSATAALLSAGAEPLSKSLRARTDGSETREMTRTTVEVWNATNEKGLALKVVRKLRKAGFDVVKWGNYSSRQKRTLVRDHRGMPEPARAIVEALDSPRIEVFTRVETEPLVDVEVILGQDYINAEVN